MLQKVNRDTMSFATKLSFIEYANGEQRDVMKVRVRTEERRELEGYRERRGFITQKKGENVGERSSVKQADILMSFCLFSLFHFFICPYTTALQLPKTDAGKTSLPGVLRVKVDKQTGREVVLPRGRVCLFAFFPSSTCINLTPFSFFCSCCSLWSYFLSSSLTTPLIFGIFVCILFLLLSSFPLFPVPLLFSFLSVVFP